MAKEFDKDCFINFAWDDFNIVKEMTDEMRGRVKGWLCDYRTEYAYTMSKKIQESLNICRHAVVIITEKFPYDDWVLMELEYIQKIMGKEGRRIIPVWINVNRDYVKSHFPMIADRVAIMAEFPRSDTIEIAGRLITLLKPEGKKPPSY